MTCLLDGMWGHVPNVDVQSICMQPTKVKETIDKVKAAHFDALPSVLDGFSWSYDKVRQLHARCMGALLPC